MHDVRSQACGAVLDDGRVLVAGGNHNTKGDPVVPIASAELFDPKTDRWSPARQAAHPRLGCAAVALPRGRMLVIGGYSSPADRYLRDVELFDHGAWKTVGRLATPRAGATATIAGGRVLVVGGETETGNTTDETIALP
jgi:N-acetylneuraminic acid mutarotase